MEHDILIEEDGTVRFIYADELAEVFAGEAQTTERASNVEPHPTAGHGWYADMIPSGGPVLGADGTVIYRHEFSYGNPDALWATLKPFPTRQAALDAEREWLRREKGL